MLGKGRRGAGADGWLKCEKATAGRETEREVKKKEKGRKDWGTGEPFQYLLPLIMPKIRLFILFSPCFSQDEAQGLLAPWPRPSPAHHRSSTDLSPISYRHHTGPTSAKDPSARSAHSAQLRSFSSAHSAHWAHCLRPAQPTLSTRPTPTDQPTSSPISLRSWSMVALPR